MPSKFHYASYTLAFLKVLQTTAAASLTTTKFFFSKLTKISVKQMIRIYYCNGKELLEIWKNIFKLYTTNVNLRQLNVKSVSCL